MENGVNLWSGQRPCLKKLSQRYSLAGDTPMLNSKNKAKALTKEVQERIKDNSSIKK
jgi:hypothetical protein